VAAGDPVSWMVVERGWTVRDETGRELGRVSEVTGDPEADIFHGIEYSHGLLGTRESVPSERVVEIREGEVVIRK
jgi:uncharacterized protein YrrD